MNREKNMQTNNESIINAENREKNLPQCVLGIATGCLEEFVARIHPGRLTPPPHFEERRNSPFLLLKSNLTLSKRSLP